MPAIVERDGAPTGAGERAYPARIEPVRFLGGGKTVHQHDRLALPLVEIGDFHITVFETCHSHVLKFDADLNNRKPSTSRHRRAASLWCARIHEVPHGGTRRPPFP